MGQGTDSCGGWDLEYDPVYEGLEDGTWLNGMNVSEMKTGHLQNAIYYAKRRARSATFSCTEEDWQEWVNVLSNELTQRQATSRASKPTSKQPASVSTTKQPVRGKKIKRNCNSCGADYEARVADVNRGWGLTCSKRCAGTLREGINSSFRKLKG
jgi:hypothetical protein